MALASSDSRHCDAWTVRQTFTIRMLMRKCLCSPPLLSGARASRAHKSNSTPNTRPIGLHATDSGHHHGRRFAIRLHLHSAFLHSELDLVVPSVSIANQVISAIMMQQTNHFAAFISQILHVRLVVPRLLDTGHHVLGDHHSVVLFPFVLGGLSLVVAVILDVRFDGRLSVCLLLPLLCHKAVHPRRTVDLLVLWLHAHHGLFVLFAHGLDRFRSLFLVCAEDLQRRQGRLSTSPV